MQFNLHEGLHRGKNTTAVRSSWLTRWGCPQMEMDVVRNTSGSKTPIPVLEVPTVMKECILSFADKGRKKFANVLSTWASRFWWDRQCRQWHFWKNKWNDNVTKRNINVQRKEWKIIRCSTIFLWPKYELCHCLPGAQSDKDCTEDEDGHGAAILSLKSHVKLIPVVLSNSISVGKLRSRQPTITNAGISIEVQRSVDQTR